MIRFWTQSTSAREKKKQKKKKNSTGHRLCLLLKHSWDLILAEISHQDIFDLWYWNLTNQMSDWPVLLLFRFRAIIVLGPCIVISKVFSLLHTVDSLFILPMWLHGFPGNCSSLGRSRLQGVYPFRNVGCSGESGGISVIQRALEVGDGGCHVGCLWLDFR